MALPLTSYFWCSNPCGWYDNKSPHITPLTLICINNHLILPVATRFCLAVLIKATAFPKQRLRLKQLLRTTRWLFGVTSRRKYHLVNKTSTLILTSQAIIPITVHIRFSSVGYNGTNETTIVVTATTLVSGGVLGNLYYNTQTSAALLSEATAKTKQALYEVAYCGSNTNNYKVRVQNDSSYRFNIVDRCGDTLATSSESDFLSQMAAELTGRNFTIENNSANSNTTEQPARSQQRKTCWWFRLQLRWMHQQVASWCFQAHILWIM